MDWRAYFIYFLLAFILFASSPMHRITFNYYGVYASTVFRYKIKLVSKIWMKICIFCHLKVIHRPKQSLHKPIQFTHKPSSSRTIQFSAVVFLKLATRMLWIAEFSAGRHQDSCGVDHEHVGLALFSISINLLANLKPWDEFLARLWGGGPRKYNRKLRGVRTLTRTTRRRAMSGWPPNHSSSYVAQQSWSS